MRKKIIQLDLHRSSRVRLLSLSELELQEIIASFPLRLGHVASPLPFSTLRLTMMTWPLCSWKYLVTYCPAKPILVAANICVANRFTNSQGTVAEGDTNSSSINLSHLIRL